MVKGHPACSKMGARHPCTTDIDLSISTQQACGATTPGQQHRTGTTGPLLSPAAAGLECSQQGAVCATNGNLARMQPCFEHGDSHAHKRQPALCTSQLYKPPTPTKHHTPSGESQRLVHITREGARLFRQTSPVPYKVCCLRHSETSMQPPHRRCLQTGPSLATFQTSLPAVQQQTPCMAALGAQHHADQHRALPLMQPVRASHAEANHSGARLGQGVR